MVINNSIIFQWGNLFNVSVGTTITVTYSIACKLSYPMAMCNINTKFVSCNFRGTTSFGLTYSSLDGTGTKANIQWMSIGYT